VTVQDLRPLVPSAPEPNDVTRRHLEPGTTLSIVIPVFNEEAVLANLVEELRVALDTQDMPWSVFFVDDGSSDGSLARLRLINAVDPRFACISLSRNFGKEIAITAGLRHASGDAVVIMDGDLQHPPSAILKLIEKWREGYKVVIAQREHRNYEGSLRRLLAHGFYAIFRQLGRTNLPKESGDFVLLDRKAVDAINEIGERGRFFKGFCGWIGFASAGVPFSPSRRTTGRSRWDLLKLARFALDGLISFSNVPLKIWSWIGGLISISALAYAVYFFIRTTIYGPDVAGFPSLIVSIMFFAGVQLISLGFIGEYLARVYEEVKGRPLYIVAEEIGTQGQALVSQEREPGGVPRDSVRSPHHSLRGRLRHDAGHFGGDPGLGGSGAALGNERNRDDGALADASQSSDSALGSARSRTSPQPDVWSTTGAHAELGAGTPAAEPSNSLSQKLERSTRSRRGRS
jgi:polyisoprenyl-phosphate glycosyltransferase